MGILAGPFDADGTPLDIPTAYDPAPGPDTNFLNITLEIDPNWPHYSQFLGNSSNGNLPVQFLYVFMVMQFSTIGDDGMSEAFPANYATTEVIGRAEQFKTFMGSGNRQINLTFKFAMQGDGGSIETINDFPPAVQSAFEHGILVYNGTGTAEDQVIKPARWLESLKQPVPDVNNNGLSYAPPPMLLTVGNIFAGRVIVEDATIKWLGPFVPGTMYPTFAEVEMTFTVVRNSLAGADYRPFYGGTAYYSEFFQFPTIGPVDTGG